MFSFRLINLTIRHVMRFFGQIQLAFLFFLFSFLTREITQSESKYYFFLIPYHTIFFLFLETAVYLIVSIGAFRGVCCCCCCCCCKNVCIVYEYCLLRIKLYYKLSFRFATLSFICNEIFLNFIWTFARLKVLRLLWCFNHKEKAPWCRG